MRPLLHTGDSTPCTLICILETASCGYTKYFSFFNACIAFLHMTIPYLTAPLSVDVWVFPVSCCSKGLGVSSLRMLGIYLEAEFLEKELVILIDVPEFSSLEAVLFCYPTSSGWKGDWLCLDPQGEEPDSVPCGDLRRIILRCWPTKKMSFLNLEEYLIDRGLDFVDWFTKPTYYPIQLCGPPTMCRTWCWGYTDEDSFYPQGTQFGGHL